MTLPGLLGLPHFVREMPSIDETTYLKYFEHYLPENYKQDRPKL